MKTYVLATGQTIQTFPDLIYSATLAANVAQTITTPSTSSMGCANGNGSGTKYVAEFKPQEGTNIWVANNATAEVQNTSVDTSSSELVLPGMLRIVNGGDVLSFITSETNAYFSVSFRQLVG